MFEVYFDIFSLGIFPTANTEKKAPRPVPQPTTGGPHGVLSSLSESYIDISLYTISWQTTCCRKSSEYKQLIEFICL